jgi:hypothetical protein
MKSTQEKNPSKGSTLAIAQFASHGHDSQDHSWTNWLAARL